LAAGDGQILVCHGLPVRGLLLRPDADERIVNLATTIPSAPGYVGTFDAPGIAVLQAYAVPKAIAAAYTLALHAALWAPVTLLGGYYMLRKGIRWSEEIEKAKAEA
jgi:hypothetical protein